MKVVQVDQPDCGAKEGLREGTAPRQEKHCPCEVPDGTLPTPGQRCGRRKSLYWTCLKLASDWQKEKLSCNIPVPDWRWDQRIQWHMYLKGQYGCKGGCCAGIKPDTLAWESVGIAWGTWTFSVCQEVWTKRLKQREGRNMHIFLSDPLA